VTVFLDSNLVVYFVEKPPVWGQKATTRIAEKVYEKAVGWRRTPHRGVRPTGTLPFGGCPSAVSVGLASMNRGSVPPYVSPTTFSYTL